jgi:trehalose 6-phosphate phosphatase
VNSARAPAWPSEPALFLDLDGTVLEFAAEPDAVVPSRRLRALLGRLPAATDGAVAFISGRPIAQLDALFAPHRFAVAGIHGLERRDADGRLTTAAPPAEAIERFRALITTFVAAHPGTLAEDKQLSLALHYRKRPDLDDEVRRFCERTAAELPASLEILRGNRVVEIKPSGTNKGNAIRFFMERKPFAGRTPVFVGDDVTDEDGFVVVNELGGVSVKVDTGSTAAAWRLPDIDAVLGWLETLVAERCTEGSTNA